MRTLSKVILGISFLLFMLSAANAAVPHLLNYQGRLTDKQGKPLEGNYNITFKIFDQESAGILLCEETHSNVAIQKGLFSVMLGAGTPVSGSKFADLSFDKPYFLEIKVGNEVMRSRQQITSSGYAIRAEVAEGVKGTENIFPASGNAGIGITNPAAKLEVAGEGTIRLAPRSSLPSSSQEGTIFYHSSDQRLYIYTSAGWKMLAIANYSITYPDEKIYACGGECNLSTQVHFTWSNVSVPLSMNNLRIKYEWRSWNGGYDYYRHNIQVLVNGTAVESFMTYETGWTPRDNTYNVSSYLRHDGTDTVRIQLTDTGTNEEDNYGFRNVYLEFK